MTSPEDRANELRKMFYDLKAMLSEVQSERDALRDSLSAIVGYFDGAKCAPGHNHNVPGVWDDDESNGDDAGKECEWCKMWNNAVELVKGGAK